MASTTTDLFTIIVSSTRLLSFSLLICGCLNYPSWAQNGNACFQKDLQRDNCLKIVKTNVVEDQVTLILKATQANGRNINNLDPRNFTIKVDGVEITTPATNWQQPIGQEQPLPARIIMLLDYSGSMEAKDSSGVTKIEGAIKGMENFLVKLSKSSADIKVSIVPFGVTDRQQCQGYRVSDWLLREGNPQNQQILNGFFAPNAIELQNYLNFLRTNPVCPATATNLYDALAKTMEFLGDRNNKEFYPPAESKQPQPKLFILLLSDGFNSVPFHPLYTDVNSIEQRCNQAHLKKLQDEYLNADKYADINIYTLGYGLTPEELGKRYQLGRPATCQDLNFNPKQEELPVPAKEFVDREALNKIANSQNGFSDLSGHADGIVQGFSDFHDSILGEYKVTYKQPNAERSSKHQVEVTVPFENQQLSDTKEYTLSGIGGFSVPLPVRFLILGVAIAFAGIFGAIPFYFWVKRLK